MLGVVRADVLHSRCGQAPDERHELDLLRREGVGLAAAEGDETERRRTDEQRRGETRAHSELEQLVLFRMETIREIPAVDRPPTADRLEDRSRHWSGAARR